MTADLMVKSGRDLACQLRRRPRAATDAPMCEALPSGLAVSSLFTRHTRLPGTPRFCDIPITGTGQLAALLTFQNLNPPTLGMMSGSGGATTGWQYDPSTGEPTHKNYADGSQDVYTHGGDLLTGITEPGVEGDSFTYNDAAELTSWRMTDSVTGIVSSTVVSQDELGRPVVTADQDNGKNTTEIAAYTPDQQLQSESFSSAAGATVKNDYDPASGNVAAQTITNLTGEQAPVQTSYGYDPNTKRLATIEINGVTLTYAYVTNSDQVNRMTTGAVDMQWLPDSTDAARNSWITATDQVNHSAMFIDWTASAQFNQQDQRTGECVVQIDSTGAATVNAHYTYTYNPAMADALTSVSATNNGTTTYTYAFDGAGNFTTNTGITTTLGAANSVNQYSNLTYNGRGDMTGDGTHAYGYDAEDRLISVAPNIPAAGSTEEKYGYDGNGRRLWMDVYTWNTDTSAWVISYSRHYLWNGNQLASVLDGNDNLLENYTYGPMGLAAVTDFPADPANPDPAAGAKTYVAVIDAHGNTVELIDPGDLANGIPATVAANFYYDPYGKLLATSCPAAGICIALGKGYLVDAATPWLGFASSPGARDTSGDNNGLSCCERCGVSEHHGYRAIYTRAEFSGRQVVFGQPRRSSIAWGRAARPWELSDD